MRWVFIRRLNLFDMLVFAVATGAQRSAGWGWWLAIVVIGMVLSGAGEQLTAAHPSPTSSKPTGERA